CTGIMGYQGRYAHCWYHPGHGYLDMVGAIKNSCDVYFYQVGIRFGLRKFFENGSRLGFNQKTGLDLPSEMRPLFPKDYQTYAKSQGYQPAYNHVMSFAIGQGATSMTQVKLATNYEP